MLPNTTLNDFGLVQSAFPETDDDDVEPITTSDRFFPPPPPHLGLSTTCLNGMPRFQENSTIYPAVADSNGRGIGGRASGPSARERKAKRLQTWPTAVGAP